MVEDGGEDEGRIMKAEKRRRKVKGVTITFKNNFQ